MKGIQVIHRAAPGVALLGVLWALAILSLAVLSLGTLLDATMSQESSLLSATRALLAAESGLEMVKNPKVNGSNYQEAVRQLNAILYPSGKNSGASGISFSVSMKREGAWLDLNRLAANPVLCQQILGRLFKEQWKVDPEIADRAIDSLIDWVDSDDFTQLNGAERRQYERIRRPGPRNAPMLGPDEFMRIFGWRELQEAVRDKNKIELSDRFVVGGAEKLDLMGAEADLIEAVLGLSEGGSQAWLDQRNGADQIAFTADDVQDPSIAARLLGVSLEALNERATLQSRWRVVSVGKVGETTRTIEAVLSEGTPRKVEARWLQ